MAYTQAAVERAMKVHEVLMQALNGRQPWIQVAEVLGVSARTVRRLRWRYERDGFTGLYDHRHHTPSPRAVPLAEVQRILQLYRDRYGPRDGHPGFNVRHFYERARREHGVTVSYSFVKKALQAAHLVGKRRPRGRHRRRQAPIPTGPSSPRWAAPSPGSASSISWASRRRPGAAASAPTARCKAGSSTSSAWPGSGPCRPPIATCGSTSSPRTTRRLVGRPPILTARSCPSCATTSRRSSAMKRNASSPATTPSPSSASCSSSTNSAAAAPVPAAGCSCVATSMGSIRCGGGRAASAASRPPDAHSERRRPDPGGSQADRSRVKRERSDHLSTTATPRQRTDARAYVVLRMVPPDGSAHPHTVDLEGVALPAA